MNWQALKSMALYIVYKIRLSLHFKFSQSGILWCGIHIGGSMQVCKCHMQLYSLLLFKTGLRKQAFVNFLITKGHSSEGELKADREVCVICMGFHGDDSMLGFLYLLLEA